MNQLKKYGIQFNIVKTYSNGVRIGNIPNHDKKSKRTGTGQTWFPKNWSSKEIQRAGEHVASLKSNRHVKDGERMQGMWKNVRVVVIRTNGQIGTIFPDSAQPERKRGKNK